MEQTISKEPLRYKGMNAHYTDIAVRGTDDTLECLGLGVEYAIHPKGQGCFILRFVAHGKGVKPKNFKHLMYRESAKFLIPGTDTTSAEMFKGLRLNKIAIPAFEPAVAPHEVDKYSTKFGIWLLLEEWISEQVLAEGFTLTANLLKEIRGMAVGYDSSEETIKSVVQFPDLTSQEEHKAALKLVQKPEEDDEDSGDGDDDKDEDGEGDEKDWMN